MSVMGKKSHERYAVDVVISIEPTASGRVRCRLGISEGPDLRVVIPITKTQYSRLKARYFDRRADIYV